MNMMISDDDWRLFIVDSLMAQSKYLFAKLDMLHSHRIHVLAMPSKMTNLMAPMGKFFNRLQTTISQEFGSLWGFSRRLDVSNFPVFIHHMFSVAASAELTKKECEVAFGKNGDVARMTFFKAGMWPPSKMTEFESLPEPVYYERCYSDDLHLKTNDRLAPMTRELDIATPMESVVIDLMENK